MAFFEVEFPKFISYRSVGGPGFSTIVNEGQAGQELRKRNWNNSLGKWQVSLISPSVASFSGTRQQFIDLIQTFFLAVSGKQDAFRLKDHRDFYWNTPQVLGVGDGSNVLFQLIKNYSMGSRTYVRQIVKPIWSTISDWQGNALPNTVTIALNGIATTAFSLDATTGIITMNSAPAGGVVVTSPSGQFHFPARFDVDHLPIQLEDSDVSNSNGIISVNAIDLVEVLCGNF